ncbi:DUF6473 family protein [Rhizorhabdus argentea]|uniref:DUF6473 family protein n=1 Tax=Rhizorhabdus argentea TaxID=1387174 RepID=UPI0030ED0CAB
MVNYHFKADDHPNEWFMDYSKRDYEIVDYGYYELPEAPDVKFRAPLVPAEDMADGNYFSCVGGAHTKGVYIEHAYPEVLADRIGVPSLNLGLGGAGPGFYLMNPALIDVMNRGRFVILQLMTARTEPNSAFAPYGFVESLFDIAAQKPITSMEAWTRIFNEEPDKAPQYVAESRANWLRRHHELLDRITVPVILFYFSDRPLDQPIDYDARSTLEIMRGFPHFVDVPSVEALKPRCAAYAECTSVRNFPHPLMSRFTGEQVEVNSGAILSYAEGFKFTVNDYYPSSEMHQDAAVVLERVVRNLPIAPAG